MALLTIAASVGLVFGIVFILIKFAKWYPQHRRDVRRLEEFPHEPGHWFWGHLLEYPGPNEEGLKFQRDMVAKFPYTNMGWMGPFFPMVMVNHPETVKTILKTSEPKARATYNFLGPWLGDGLLLSGGDKWSRNRRLLTPAFHFDILRPYVAIKNRATDVLLDKLEGFHKRGEYFEVFTHVSLFTLDVILKCAFSYDTDCQTIGDDHPYVKAVYKLNDLAVDRFFKPWLHPDWIYFLTPNGREFRKNCDYVHAVAEDIIHKRKIALAMQSGGGAARPAGLEDTGGRLRRCLDFLDILLTARDENNQGLTTGEIRDEVDTFLFEGHDTTASAISWMMFSFAEHPDIQAKAQEEVDSLLEGRECQDILWEDLSKLPYLTMCLKEAMRLHTPVPFIQRQLTKDTVIDGHTAPKGTVINIVLYNIHHNCHVWEDSLEFRPERFSPENVDKKDAYAFVPFSAGPRNCIGQNFAMDEMKIVMARLLRRFKLELDKNHVVKKKEMAVMKAENGIMMKVIPRNIRGKKAATWA